MEDVIYTVAERIFRSLVVANGKRRNIVLAQVFDACKN